MISQNDFFFFFFSSVIWWVRSFPSFLVHIHEEDLCIISLTNLSLVFRWTGLSEMFERYPMLLKSLFCVYCPWWVFVLSGFGGHEVKEGAFDAFLPNQALQCLVWLCMSYHLLVSFGHCVVPSHMSGVWSCLHVACICWDLPIHESWTSTVLVMNEVRSHYLLHHHLGLFPQGYKSLTKLLPAKVPCFFLCLPFCPDYLPPKS